MNTTGQTKIAKANKEQRQSIVSLLQSEKLPVIDLPVSLDNFFVSLDDNRVIGAIGLEQYDNCGLLRSMVVDKNYRGKNIASQLVQQLEDYATTIGIDEMYLLTETAPEYFKKKGYDQISRDEVPKPIQASSEFSQVCPVSAIVMKKLLIKYE
jgi:amino-acid N-acetyltransferase